MRFALFGAGTVGTVHAANIVHHPRAALDYVFDINLEAAQRVAAQYGAQVADSEAQIWTADAVDAVLIASSTNTHVDRSAAKSHSVRKGGLL